MERAELLELAFLLWGEETEAEARVAAVAHHRDADTAVRALLRTRSPSVVGAARDPWWVDPEVLARGRRTARVLAGLPLPDRAAVVLTGLRLATAAELPRRFGLPADVPGVLGPDPRGALIDRLAARRPPERDDEQAAAAARADRRRRWVRVGVGAIGVLALGAAAWLIPRPAPAPDAAPESATPARPTAAVARLAALGAGDTPVLLATEVAVDAASAVAGVSVDELVADTVWSGRLDTGPAGEVDAVVVRVTLPDGTTVASTAFAQGRENQTFLVAPCGVQPDGPVTAARCSTADPGTGETAAAVVVTGLSAPATLVAADDVPLAALVPGPDGTTTARDDAAEATTLHLADGTEVVVATP